MMYQRGDSTQTDRSQIVVGEKRVQQLYGDWVPFELQSGKKYELYG